MAISTDTLVDFFGTQDLITSTAAASIGSSAFSSTAHIVNWTNDDDAPLAGYVLIGTFGTAPAAGGAIHLYHRHIAIGAASTDMTQPSTTFKRHLAASFPVNTSTAVQILTAPLVSLPNMEASQVYQHFIENQASQTLSSDWTLHVTPMTQGPSTA